ncbi:MAG: hypothetical protein ACJ8AW_00615, partial [Rhodopila sp.]
PSFPRLRPNRGYNAGFPAFEVEVAYPFHPMAGRTVLVTGEYEHGGIRYHIIRRQCGGTTQIPAWMFDPASSSIAVTEQPRLPIPSLIQLRDLVDDLLACRPGKHDLGGIDNGKAALAADRPVRRVQAGRRDERGRAPKSHYAASHTVDGGIEATNQQPGERQ